MPGVDVKKKTSVPHALGLEAQLLSGSAHLKDRINLEQEMDRILFLCQLILMQIDLKIKLHKGF